MPMKILVSDSRRSSLGDFQHKFEQGLRFFMSTNEYLGT